MAQQSFVERAMGIESAERSAELRVDDQAGDNSAAKGSRRTSKSKAKPASKQPRRKHTFAVDDDVFRRLRLTAVDRDADMSDLLNNALRAYLPKTIRIEKDNERSASDQADVA